MLSARPSNGARRSFSWSSRTACRTPCWRHARDFKARKASHEIAKRCPLPAADAVATVHLLKEELPTTVKKTEVKVLSFEEKMKADAAEAKTRACGRSRSRSRLRFCSAVTEPQAHN